MFTGIVEELGEVLDLSRRPQTAVLTVRAPTAAASLPPGGSIAVDGCCLTVLDGTPAPDTFRADVMGETLARTTIGDLAPGDRVNLERAVPAAGRLAGHVVQGHVDGTGRFLECTRNDGWDLIRVGVPAALTGQLAAKGSVACDGVSLTVVDVSPPGTSEPWFSVGLIPTTLRGTTLGRRQPGDAVNLETDVIAKYVERLLGSRASADPVARSGGSTAHRPAGSVA